MASQNGEIKFLVLAKLWLLLLWLSFLYLLDWLAFWTLAKRMAKVGVWWSSRQFWFCKIIIIFRFYPSKVVTNLLTQRIIHNQISWICRVENQAISMKQFSAHGKIDLCSKIDLCNLFVSQTSILTNCRSLSVQVMFVIYVWVRWHIFLYYTKLQKKR